MRSRSTALAWRFCSHSIRYRYWRKRQADTGLHRMDRKRSGKGWSECNLLCKLSSLRPLFAVARILDAIRTEFLTAGRMGKGTGPKPGVGRSVLWDLQQPHGERATSSVRPSSPP